MARLGNSGVYLKEPDKRPINRLLDIVLKVVGTVKNKDGVEKQMVQYQEDWDDTKVLEHFKESIPYLNIDHIRSHRQRAYGLLNHPAGAPASASQKREPVRNDAAVQRIDEVEKKIAEAMKHINDRFKTRTSHALELESRVKALEDITHLLRTAIERAGLGSLLEHQGKPSSISKTGFDDEIDKIIKGSL